MNYDMIIQNCKVYNSFTKSFEYTDVAVKNGIFTHIEKNIMLDNTYVVDGKGKYMIPGLVDIHMHIESSMSIPSRFSDAVLAHGTTSVVADPHEIANVFGREGILSFLSQDTLLDIFYGIPSSVPSTNSNLETTGGAIGIEEVKELLMNNKIVCLGEVMNFYDVCYEPESLSAKIIGICKKLRPILPLEGHCPKIKGRELSSFISKGISADHTHQTKESVIEKITNGMFLEIQGKSMTQEVLETLIEHDFYEYFCFVTDDVMADHLRYGHLNTLVQKAIEMGMKPEMAIYCATFTPARRMHLEDRGTIAPGRIADFIMLDDIYKFHITDVYKNGKKVIKTKKETKKQFPEHFYQSIQCREAEKKDFKINLKGTSALCNIMEIEPHSTFTKHIQKWLPVTNGFLDLENYALLTVYERYGKNGNISHGIVGNTIKKKGAIATSWAHDHHNVMVLGNDVDDMVLAQKEIIKMQGGYVVVKEHKIIASAALEVGGIVSERTIEEIGEDIDNVRKAMQDLGYVHDNEIMSFSTLSLLVSPQLKISDKGMIDTTKQKIIKMVEEIR